MAGFIEEKGWKNFLDEFTKRNHFRATRLEVVGEVGAQEQEEYLPLIGVSFEQFISMVCGHVRSELEGSSFDESLSDDDFRVAALTFDDTIRRHIRFS